MPYTFGNFTGGAADAKITLFAPAARHLHDFVRRGAAHDRIVDDQHVLALELDAHGVQLLAHRLLAHRLARHDEGAADVTVLEEAFAVLDAELGGHLHRGGGGG